MYSYSILEWMILIVSCSIFIFTAIHLGVKLYRDSDDIV